MVYESKQHVWSDEGKENPIYFAQIFVKATTEEEAVFMAKRLAKELSTSEEIQNSINFVALAERMS